MTELRAAGHRWRGAAAVIAAIVITVDDDRHDYPDHVYFYLTGNGARAWA
jgi:hypothetical protein